MTQVINNIQFQIQHIKTDQFAIIEDHFSSKLTVELLTKIEFKLDLSKKLIGTFMTFEFHQKSKVFIKIACSCHFQIENTSWESLKKTATLLSIPKSFLLHLATITTGTSRGILSCKIEGTPFSSFIIPTINLTKMVLSDAEFALN